jgi:hypothetical protein
MPLRFLFGPVSTSFANQNLHGPRQAGNCLAFNAEGDADLAIRPGDTWDAVQARFPAGWQPDVLALWLPYTTVPACLWSAPLVRVGLATDWHLLWHAYRRHLPACDLVFTDTLGAERLRQAGLSTARAGNLSGCERAFLETAWPDGPRDIDILLVGNLNPAVQRERLPWVSRLARLGRRWRVAIRAGVFGDSYRKLLARTRIVFQHSARHKCGCRAFEAAAAGALIFQEQDNRDLPAYFRDRQECVYYHPDQLEALLDYYLEHEDERRALAEAARARVRLCTFEAGWQALAEQIEQDWPALQARARSRPEPNGEAQLTARCLQALRSRNYEDRRLLADLEKGLAASATAAGHNALGALLGRHAQGKSHAAAAAEVAVEHFRKALAGQPSYVLAGLNLAEALDAAGQKLAAIEAARRTLETLHRDLSLPEANLEGLYFGRAFDFFQVEWERAAWSHAGHPAEEAKAKRALLGWRLYTLLGHWTGEPGYFYEAALLRPDLPASRVALGGALARASRPLEALPHLRQALAELPLDRPAARVLFQVLGTLGDSAGRRQFAEEQGLLCQALPALVPAESWFILPKPPSQEEAVPPGAPQDQPPAASEKPPDTAVPPAAAASAPAAELGTLEPVAPVRQGKSLVMIVRNEEHNLPDCLRSVQDIFDDLVVVDTGSQDRTRAVAESFGARVFDFPWIDSFSAARNECLRHARGKWAMWLDADDRVDADNRPRLIELLAGLGDEIDAYAVKVRSVLDAKRTAFRLLDQVRLFRILPEIRWDYRIHEQILGAVNRLGGVVRWTRVIIDHVGYQDAGQRRGKLERNLRLLEMDRVDRPQDGFTLFNLGWTLLDLGKTAEALTHLQGALQHTSATSSTLRKLYHLLVVAQRQLKQPEQALATCREGLQRFADDAEILCEQGLLLRDRGDLDGAEDSWLRLLDLAPGQFFASEEVGLRGFRTRQLLAEVYRKQQRWVEAEVQWRAALKEQAAFEPAWLGLSELYLRQERWPDLDYLLEQLEPQGAAPARLGWLRARGQAQRKEWAAARRTLAQVIPLDPEALGPRVLLSQVLLQEGRDWAAAEQACQAVLELDPGHGETRHNLELLRRRLGRQALAG